jgi:hypothetical protein
MAMRHYLRRSGRRDELPAELPIHRWVDDHALDLLEGPEPCDWRPESTTWVKEILVWVEQQHRADPHVDGWAA